MKKKADKLLEKHWERINMTKRGIEKNSKKTR